MAVILLLLSLLAVYMLLQTGDALDV